MSSFASTIKGSKSHSAIAQHGLEYIRQLNTVMLATVLAVLGGSGHSECDGGISALAN